MNYFSTPLVNKKCPIPGKSQDFYIVQLMQEYCSHCDSPYCFLTELQKSCRYNITPVDESFFLQKQKQNSNIELAVQTNVFIVMLL